MSCIQIVGTISWLNHQKTRSDHSSRTEVLFFNVQYSDPQCIYCQLFKWKSGIPMVVFIADHSTIRQIFMIWKPDFRGAWIPKIGILNILKFRWFSFGMVGYNNSYSYGPNNSKTEPLEIQTKWRPFCWDFLWFWTKCVKLVFVQISDLFGHFSPMLGSLLYLNKKVTNRYTQPSGNQLRYNDSPPTTLLKGVTVFSYDEYSGIWITNIWIREAT